MKYVYYPKLDITMTKPYKPKIKYNKIEIINTNQKPLVFFLIEPSRNCTCDPHQFEIIRQGDVIAIVLIYNYLDHGLL